METLIPDTTFALLFVSAGLALFFLEVFIPTGGVLGVVAAGILGLGIYGLFLHGQAALGVGTILGSIVFVVFAFLLMLKRLRFTTVQDTKTFTSVDQGIAFFEGKSGIAETPLRPAGVARIDGKRVDVVAASGFIERNTPVQVVETRGNRVVVREITKNEDL